MYIRVVLPTVLYTSVNKQNTTLFFTRVYSMFMSTVLYVYIQYVRLHMCHFSSFLTFEKSNELVNYDITFYCLLCLPKI